MKGWLKDILEQARRDVNSRPTWEKDRVYGRKLTDSMTLVIRALAIAGTHEYFTRTEIRTLKRIIKNLKEVTDVE